MNWPFKFSLFNVWILSVKLLNLCILDRILVRRASNSFVLAVDELPQVFVLHSLVFASFCHDGLWSVQAGLEQVKLERRALSTIRPRQHSVRLECQILCFDIDFFSWLFIQWLFLECRFFIDIEAYFFQDVAFVSKLTVFFGKMQGLLWLQW